MKTLVPLTLLLLAGCGNELELTASPVADASVRWTGVYQPTPPVCENEDERHVEPELLVTCIWSCKAFWTPLRGAGAYDVARAWRWHEVNLQYEPTGLGTDAQWSEACDPLRLTGDSQ